MYRNGFIEIRFVEDINIGPEYAYRIKIDEKTLRKLSPLPKDREIFNIMSDKMPSAAYHNAMALQQKEERDKIIDRIGDQLKEIFRDIIKSRDTINGYEQENKYRRNS